MSNTAEINQNEPWENGIKRDRDSKTGQFVEGNPGGPGRPEGSISVVATLKKELEKVPQGEKKTYLGLLVKRILKKGIIDGDVGMIKDIINRVDGMPQQAIDLTTLGKELGMRIYLPKKDERMEATTETGKSPDTE